MPPHQYFYRDTISRRIKEDPSPHEMTLSPAGHQLSISWSRGYYYYYYYYYYCYNWDHVACCRFFVQSCLFVQSGIFLVQCRLNLSNVGTTCEAIDYYQKNNRSKINIAEKLPHNVQTVLHCFFLCNVVWSLKDNIAYGFSCAVLFQEYLSRTLIPQKILAQSAHYLFTGR